MIKSSSVRAFLKASYDELKRYKFFYALVFFIGYLVGSFVFYENIVMPREHKAITATNDALLSKMDDCEAQYKNITDGPIHEAKTELAIYKQFNYLRRLYHNTECFTPEWYMAYLDGLALTLKFQNTPIPHKILGLMGFFSMRDWIYAEIQKESVLAAVAFTYDIDPIKRPDSKPNTVE